MKTRTTISKTTIAVRRRADQGRGSFDSPTADALIMQAVPGAKGLSEHEDCVPELEQALARVGELSRQLARCSHCKRVGDKEDHWQQVPLPAGGQWDDQLSSTLCPDCYKVVVEPEVAHLYEYLRNGAAEGNGWNHTIPFRLSRS